MRQLTRPDMSDWYQRILEEGESELAALMKDAEGATVPSSYLRKTLFYRHRRVQKLKDVFLEVSNSTCHVCESPIGAAASPLLEHYRPKQFAGNKRKDRRYPRHYWWLLYDWANFQVLCQVCNRYKASLFPVAGERAMEESRGAALAAEMGTVGNFVCGP